MRHITLKHTALALILLASPLAATAQTDVDLDPEAGARLAFTLDKRLTRGLHITLEEEVRLDNNFTGFDRLQHTLSASYKVHPNVKLGLGYALINPYSAKNSEFKGARHRLMADITGTLHLNLWNISLKERLQTTHRTGSYNTYQSPATAWGLKSRLAVKYKGWQPRGWTPYAYIEVRNTFSAPTVTADYNAATGTYLVPGTTSSEGEAGWFLDGFDGTYVDRVRMCLGVDYRMTRASTLTFYLLADRIDNKAIDANAEGTRLKAYNREKGLVGSLGFNYTYAF